MVKTNAINRIAFAAVLAGSLGAAWLVYHRLVLPGGPLGWDESAHALYGLLIAHDARQHDWVSLVFDSYRQVYWPPGHSLLLGLVFLLAGPSDAAARGASVLCLIFLPPLLFFAARRLNAPCGAAVGSLAAWLALTSPPIASHSALCLLEMPGLVALMSTLLVYISLRTRDAPDCMYTWVGICLLASFFAKTNYGVLLGMALAVAEIGGPRASAQGRRSRRFLYIALPVVLVLSLWFAYPPKIRETWGALVNNPWGVRDRFGAEGLLFYPRAFIQLSGSAWMAAAYVLGVAAGFRHWRDARYRLLLALVLIQLLIGEFHQTKEVRHILPIYPALFLLGGSFAVSLWDKTKAQKRILFKWSPRLVVLLSIAHSGTLPWTLSPPAREPLDEEILVQTAAVLRPPGTGVAVATFEAICLPCLDWLLITQKGVLECTGAGSIMLVDQTRKFADTLSRSAVPGWVGRLLLPTVTRYERVGKSRTFYVRDYSLSEGEALARTLGRQDVERVLTITSEAGRPAVPQSAFGPVLRAASLALGSTRRFEHGPLRSDKQGLNLGRVPIRLDAYFK